MSAISEASSRIALQWLCSAEAMECGRSGGSGNVRTWCDPHFGDACGRKCADTNI